MIAEQLRNVVDSNPDKVAINDFRIGKVTYAQLWELICSYSTSISSFTQNYKYIGLLADQDLHAVLALISAVLAGKTIIPIDPRLDAGSIKEMLLPFTNIIICQSIYADSLDKQLLKLNLEDLVIGNTTNYDFSNKDTDAYILHTSGTTGKPKPVLARQSTLLHVAKELASRYYIDEKSNVLQFSYLSFDSSLAEIFSTLLSGGTLVIPGSNLREDMYRTLDKLLAHKDVTVATLPPSVASGCGLAALSRLDTLILAGEECPLNLANKLFKNAKHLINAYGPTESIICAATYEIKSLQNSGRVPIGKPLSGMRIEIANTKRVMNGVPGSGEMLLFSNYLAVGYPGSDKETSDKFRTDPSTGSVFYMTGDVGLVNDDGNYEFIGRIDNQVKINGQRVELESIEAKIREVAGIDELVVIYDKQLYCVFKDPETVQTRDIRSLLSEKMLSYTIPNIFIPIDFVPLDRNGKIDRCKIIKEIKSKIDNRDGIESTNDDKIFSDIFEIWKQVLNIPSNEIGHNSDFFELGGDSLAALKLISLVNEKYSQNVKLADILRDSATPAKMSNMVKNNLKQNVARNA